MINNFINHYDLNFILLEGINNKSTIFLTLDKKIKFNNFNIVNALINIDLLFKVIFYF